MIKKVSTILLAVGFCFALVRYVQNNYKTDQNILNNKRVTESTSDTILTLNNSISIKNEEKKTEISINDKINYIDKLEINSLEDNNTQQLIALVISENPYTNREVLPHSIEEINQANEGALRVMALRKLNDSLQLEEYEEIVSFIIANAKEEFLKELAKRSLESRSKGVDYFKTILEAAENLEVPGDLIDSQDTGEHSH